MIFGERSMQAVNKPQIDLYLAKTPRHWWLAHAIAAANKRPAVLLVTEGFHGAEELVNLSKTLNNSPFIDIQLIPGKRSAHRCGFWQKTFYKRIEWWLQKPALDAILATYEVKRYITANLTALPTQYLHHKLQSTNGKNVCEFLVLDDGLVQYRPEKITKKSRLDEAFNSLVHGFKICFPVQDTIPSYFSQGWFFAPNLLHPRLQHLQSQQISPDFFSSDVISALTQQVFNKLNLNTEHWQTPKIVLVFSNLSYLETDCPGFSKAKFEQTITQFITKNQLTDHAIWVKYHPREHEPDVFNLKKYYPNCHFLPSQIPFEVITASLNPGDWVVGELSTVLFDVALNRPDVQVHSLMCVTKQKPEYDLFVKAGVCISQLGN
jgi:hypothetical protein